jgi:hypothetical protein
MDEWSDNELAGFVWLQMKKPRLVFPYQTPASAFCVILLQLPVTACGHVFSVLESICFQNC